MYLIGRPWIPPLAFTHLKYASTIFAIVVKSTPGISMLIVPILIGAPVAFLPLPRPHFATPAWPAAPTWLVTRVWLPPVAMATSTRATAAVATSARPAITFLDLIGPPLVPLVLRGRLAPVHVLRPMSGPRDP